MSTQAIVVSLYGGPGTGKSTTMAGVFSWLKWRKVNCEMAPEFAKEKVWEKSLGILNNQIYVFGKQLHTLHRVIDQVEVVITDSPLLLSLVYGKNECVEFKNLVIAKYKSFNNLNIFLKREKEYNPIGRLQNEEDAKKLDSSIQDVLLDLREDYYEYPATEESIKAIGELILETLGRRDI